MPGVNSQPCLKIFEKRFYSKHCQSENFVHFSWKVIKQRIPTVRPNNYYLFSLPFAVPGKGFSPFYLILIFYIFHSNAELLSDNGRAGQFHHYETSSMGRHQVVLTASCPDQNIFYRPNIYNEIFSKETERFVKSFHCRSRAMLTITV